MGAVADEQIYEFVAFTSSDPHTARRWLQRYSSVETAVSEYFDKGGTLPSESQVAESRKWEDGLFAADRNAVQGPLNKDEAEGHQVIAEDVFNQPRNTPDIENWRSGIQQSEEEQMRMAIERSSQETGVLNAGQGWQKQTTQRAPDPAYRQRGENGVPAVLRPVNESFLAPLLAILHEIPAAREALLGRSAVNNSYECGAEWWNGNISWPDDEQEDNESRIWTETQRLMAFQDATTRAYASTAPLDAALRESNTNNSSDQSFLLQRSEHAIEKYPDEPLSYLFKTEIAIPASDQELSRQSVYDLGLRIDPVVSETGGSLLDVVDNALAQAASDQLDAPEGKVAYMIRTAGVLVFFLEPPSADEAVGIKIPEDFYSGRWLEDASTSSDVQSARRNKHDVQQLLKSIDAKQKMLGTVSHLNGGDDTPVLKVLDDSISYLKSRQKLDPKILEDSKSTSSSSSSSTSSELLAELQKIRERIDAKIATLESSKKEAVESMREVSSKLNDLRIAKEQEDQEGKAKGSRYSLRGVGLSPSRFFVLQGSRDPQDLLTNTEWRWLRMEATWHSPAGWTNAETFNLQSSQSSATVAANLGKESKSKVMLVYASDDAIKDNPSSLPTPLQQFVDADNEAFAKELSPWGNGSPFSTIAERSDGGGGSGDRGSMDVQMTDDGVPILEGAIRLESNDDDNNNNGDGANVPVWYDGKENTFPAPPKLPPRMTPATPSSLLAPQPVAPASRRKNVLSNFKDKLSRSKSRESSREREQQQQQEDLLVDNDEQSMGIPAMSTEQGPKSKK